MIKCLCLNPKDNLFLKNKIANSNSQSLYISFFPCNPEKRHCDPNSDLFLKSFNFNLAVQNSYVDTNNYEEPIRYHIDNSMYQSSNDYNKIISFSLTNNTFISDNGWLLEDKISYSYVQISEKKSEIAGYYAGITPIVTVSLDSLNIVDTISRSYMKVQDLLAKIGGIINALIIITKILTFHYLRFLYIIKLASLSKEEQMVKIDSSKEHDSIDQNSQQVRLNNYIPNKIPKFSKISKITNEPNKINDDMKVLIENMNIEEKNMNQVNPLQDNTWRKQIIGTYYLTYLWYTVSCKLKKLQVYNEISQIERRIDVKTMIKLSNSLYCDLQKT